MRLQESTVAGGGLVRRIQVWRQDVENSEVVVWDDAEDGKDDDGECAGRVDGRGVMTVKRQKVRRTEPSLDKKADNAHLSQAQPIAAGPLGGSARSASITQITWVYLYLIRLPTSTRNPFGPSFK